MDVPYIENMTQEMLDCVNEFFDEDKLKQEFLHCHQQYLKAKAASNVSLPATATTGKPVIHGARKLMYVLADYWEIRRDAIKKYLPDDWVEAQGVQANMYKR